MSFLRSSLRLVILNQNLNITQNFTQTRTIKRWVAPTLRELRKRKEKLESKSPQAPQKRSGFIEWNYNAEIFAFGKRLNENFEPTVLRRAFINRSYINQEEVRQRELGIENPELNMEDNNELILNGKQLVANYVSAFLEYSLPKVPQNGIKAISNYLTSVETLAHVSSHLGCKDLVQSSKDDLTDRITLSETLLAVIGALKESSGDERAYNFIRDFICTQLNQKDLTEIWDIPNALETLKQFYVENKLGEVEPRLIGDSAKNTVLGAFNVGLYVNKKLIGKGFGEDINTGIETAAIDALRTIYGISDNMKPFNYSVQLEKASQQKAKLHS